MELRLTNSLYKVKLNEQWDYLRGGPPLPRPGPPRPLPLPLPPLLPRIPRPKTCNIKATKPVGNYKHTRKYTIQDYML